jgi:hypothetical protein
MHMADIKLHAPERQALVPGTLNTIPAARVATASDIKRKVEDEATDVADSAETSAEPAFIDAAAAASDFEATVQADVAKSTASLGPNGLVIAGGLGLLGVISALAGGGGSGPAIQPAQQHSAPVIVPPVQPDPIVAQPPRPDPTVADDLKAQMPKPDMDKPQAPPAATTPPAITPPVTISPDHPSEAPKPTEPEHAVVPPAPVVDTTPPVMPALSLKHDTGADAHDRITSDSTITVEGLEHDATWRYRLDGDKTWHAGSGPELAVTMHDGIHGVQVIQTDKAGNDSDVATLHFTLDTGAPTLTLKDDTGRGHYDYERNARVTEPGLDRDGITRDGTLTVNGLKADLSWTYSVDGGPWKTGIGNEIAASELGRDGRKTVLTRQMVTETTESGISAFSFVLDTQADDITPRLKTIDSTDAQGRPQTGHPVVILDGYEEGASAYLTLSLPDGTTRPETVIGGELTLDLQPASYQLFEFQQTDLAGNRSEHLGNFIVVPPVLP